MLDNPPERREERTYVVKAVCKGYDIRDRADGEERVVAVMEIQSCYEQGKVPIVDEKQPSLFDAQDGLGPGIVRPADEHDDEDEPDDEGDEGDEPEVDRPDFSHGAK